MLHASRAAPPSSQSGEAGAPGAPSPSIGRSSSSTPCRSGREASCTLTGEHHAVNRGSRVFRSARARAAPGHRRGRGMWSYISIRSAPRTGISRGDTSNAVYLDEVFFLIRRSNNSAAKSRARTAHAKSNALPVMVGVAAEAPVLMGR